MQRFIQLLGSPHKQLRVVQVAGTKGKGSTSAFAANILSAAGFKVGLYTSPHLIDVRERIRILQNRKEDEISRNDFARLIGKIKPCAQRLRKTELGSLTYYEILTAIAFLYFKEKATDFAVLETGIGGRLDATNVADSLVSALTPISYEHTQVLGNTLEKIAAQKAGIIKKRTQTVITAAQRPQVLRVIKKRVKKIGARLIVVTDRQYPGLKISLLGAHQLNNARVAVATVLALGNHGIDNPKQAIKQGLKNTRWPGRLQVISQRPKVVLDGAQNRASSVALKRALKECFKFGKLILVFGASQDKDVRGMLGELAPLAGHIVLTKSDNPRAMQPEAIKTFIKKNGVSFSLTGNSARALKIARQSARQEDLILVCGSLFLVGEILKKTGNEKVIIG
jgi:dihydrofolate synthase/folylpolyglutamate synthase